MPSLAELTIGAERPSEALGNALVPLIDAGRIIDEYIAKHGHSADADARLVMESLSSLLRAVAHNGKESLGHFRRTGQ